MRFNTITFALFFAVVLGVLPFLNTRRTNLFLLAASAVFFTQRGTGAFCC
jgi:hypothetical protein